jgi:hypothetical protein
MWVDESLLTDPVMNVTIDDWLMGKGYEEFQDSVQCPSMSGFQHTNTCVM